MAKILKENSDFAKRVQNVFQAMEDNNASITFMANEFRFSDTKEFADNYRQNMVLIDIEGDPVSTLPAGSEYRLKVFNT